MPSLQTDLPSLRKTVKLGGKGSHETTAWFDVKFYPYAPPGVSPVFAVTGGCNVVICRCSLQKDDCIEILRWFKDDDPDAYNSVEWSRAANGDPLVCATGSLPKINIFNVNTGALVTTLIGHGDAIHDLAISPVDPTLLASASADNSVRIWTLDAAHQRQPTAAIAFGEGHKESVLALGFHRKGRYLLSGGLDTRVNLWMLPENLKANLGSDKPAFLHYPHFASTEVHTDFIDCIKFYNDLIISRCSQGSDPDNVAGNKILLWKIDNFNSDAPPPDSVPIPPSQAVQNNIRVQKLASQVSGTRSAWGGRFQRLLQFEMPNAEPWYIRFSLFHEAQKRPVLAAGTNHSRLHLWDLQELEENVVADEKLLPVKKKNTTKKGGGLELLAARDKSIRAGSEVSNASAGANSNTSAPSSVPGDKSAKKSKAEKEKEDRLRYIGDSFKSVPSHKRYEIPKIEFSFRQVAWSRGGEWCIACGDMGMIAVFTRWEDGFPETGS